MNLPTHTAFSAVFTLWIENVRYFYFRCIWPKDLERVSYVALRSSISDDFDQVWSRSTYWFLTLYVFLYQLPWKIYCVFNLVISGPSAVLDLIGSGTILQNMGTQNTPTYHISAKYDNLRLCYSSFNKFSFSGVLNEPTVSEENWPNYTQFKETEIFAVFRFPTRFSLRTLNLTWVENRGKISDFITWER